MKVCIVGASGKLGKYMVRHALDRGYEVVGVWRELIGSANMDRRSFELNYENNILFYDPPLTADMRRRQESYIAKSLPVTPEAVEGWNWRRRLWNNAVAMLGPVL